MAGKVLKKTLMFLEPQHERICANRSVHSFEKPERALSFFERLRGFSTAAKILPQAVSLCLPRL
jgi:hypothetical protein